ncbi:MAG: hypothetical protein RR053_06890, partial [Evtepia sp.]
VRECMVVGVPDRNLGQRIRAVVCLVDGFEKDEKLAEELIRFHNETCAGYKKIRELIFMDALPRNANGKLMRDEGKKR